MGNSLKSCGFERHEMKVYKWLMKKKIQNKHFWWQKNVNR